MMFFKEDCRNECKSLDRFDTWGPFGLAYFRAYIKQLLQINKFLYTIYKFLR